nr:hypothetical protein [uncultured Carboxylicivirga sp.]
MRIGLSRLGKRKVYKNQWIATDFITIILPIIPIKTYFITKNEHKQINKFAAKFDWISVIKGFFSFWFLFWGILFTLSPPYRYLNHYFGYSEMHDSRIFGIGFLIISMVLFLLGRFSIKGRLERELLHNAIEINALPIWLTIDSIKDIIKKIDAKIYFARKGVDYDLIETLKNRDYDKEMIPLLYAMLAYKRLIEKSEQIDYYYQEIRKQYVAQQ